MQQQMWAGDEPNGLETEILQEKVAALVRISRTLYGLVEELWRLKREIDAAEPTERRQRIATFNATRERAKLYQWYLLVQRESIGLRRHRGLEEFYPIPPSLRVSGEDRCSL